MPKLIPQVTLEGDIPEAYRKSFVRQYSNLATAHSPTGTSRDTVISMPDNPELA